MRYDRADAASLGIDPRRVGFMAFFSGGIPKRSVAEKGADTAFAVAAEVKSLVHALLVRIWELARCIVPLDAYAGLPDNGEKVR